MGLTDIFRNIAESLRDSNASVIEQAKASTDFSYQHFKPLQTSTPKSRTSRIPLKSIENQQRTSEGSSLKDTPKRDNASRLSMTRQDNSLIRRRHNFSNEARGEVLQWLRTLKTEDPDRLKHVLENAGLHVHNWRRRISEYATLKKIWKQMNAEVIGGEKYSRALELLLEGDDDVLTQGAEIDAEYVAKIMASGGHIKYFNYILADSRAIPEGKTTSNMTFAEFINAVFYIGKGTDNRPIEHLKDTVRYASNSKNVMNCVAKLSHINEIWNSNGAIHVIRLFNDVPEHVSHLREEAMISAFKLSNLTNEQHGQFVHPAGYTDEMLRVHGAYLLSKAHQVFLSNLPPPIKANNVATVMSDAHLILS